MPGDTVNMVSPTGEAKAVPIDAVAEAARQGFKVETPGQAVAAVGGDVRTAGMGGILGSGLAAAGGIARGATLGLSDVVARQVGLGDTLAGAAEAHPTISTGAQIVGAVAPAFAAPASLLAKTPAGLASRAATSITALGEGAGTAARIGYAGAGAALEGGLQNAGSYVSETALADKPLAADAFMSAMGHGALWGGVAGVGLAASERALVAAKRLFPRAEVTQEAVAAAEDEAQHAITSAVDDGAALQQTARDKLREMRQQKASMDLQLKARLDEVKVARARELADVDVAARKAAAEGKAPRRVRKAMGGEDAAPADLQGVPTYPPNEDAIYSVRAGDLRGASQDAAGFDPAKVERYKAARAKGDAPYLDEPISLTQKSDGSLSVDQGRHRLAARGDDELIRARVGKGYEPSPAELAASKEYDAALARGASADELDSILRGGAKAQIAAEDAADPLMAALAGTKRKLDAGEALGGMGARAKPGRAIEDAMDDAAAVGDPAHANLVTAEREFDQAQDQLNAWLAKYPKSRVKGVTEAEAFTQRFGGGRSTPGVATDWEGGVGRFQGGGMSRTSRFAGTDAEWKAWQAKKQAQEMMRPTMAEEILGGTKKLEDIKGVGYQAPVKSEGYAGRPGAPVTADDILEISNMQLAERGLQPLDEHIAQALRAKVSDWSGDLNEAANTISNYEAKHANLVDAMDAVAPPPAAVPGAPTTPTSGAVPPGAAARAADYKAAVASKEASTAGATADAASEASKAADVISLGAAPLKAPGATKGILKHLADARSAVEVLNMLGIHAFDPGNIPVVGPILSMFLKARVAAKVFRRMGGKIPETAETLIAGKAAASRQRVIDAIDRMTTTGARVAGKSIVPAAAASSILGHSLFAPAGEKPKPVKGTPVELFNARAAEVVASQAPGAVRDAVRARIGTHGDLLEQIVGAAERKLAFLASKLPKPSGPAIAGTPAWIPSRTQMTSFARYVRGAEDPVSVIEHAASGGVVTVEETEAVAACYPELYASAQRKLIERVAKPGVALSYQRRVQLSALFRVPLDRSTEPEYARWLQESYQPDSTAQPAAPPAGTPTIQAPVDLGARTSTALDSRAGG